jgi:hypothetical protein
MYICAYLGNNFYRTRNPITLRGYLKGRHHYLSQKCQIVPEITISIPSALFERGIERSRFFLREGPCDSSNRLPQTQRLDVGRLAEGLLASIQYNGPVYSYLVFTMAVPLA